MADPRSDDRDRRVDATPEPTAGPLGDPDAEASRPVALALLLAVGAVMAVLVTGLVWSTGHGLQWW